MANGQRRKLAFRILVVPLTLVVFVLYLYFSEGWKTIKDVFAHLNYTYALIAFGVYTLALVFEQLSIALMRHHYQKRFPFLYVVHSTLLANFYEILTPGTFAFGPITHVNCMNKQGIPPAKGTTIMLVQQSCAMISLVLVSLSLILGNLGYFIGKMNVILWVCFGIALFINVATVFVYMFVPRLDKFFIKVLSGLINFLHKIHIIRKEEKKNILVVKAEDQVKKLKNNMTNLNYSAWEWIGGIFLMVFYRLCIYSIHYFSALALGLDIKNKFFVLLAAGAMVHNISCATPIPGGLGIVEVALYAILTPIIGNSTNVNFMLFFYRVVTYYYPIIIGACMLGIKIPSNEKKFDKVEGYTIIDSKILEESNIKEDK